MNVRNEFRGVGTAAATPQAAAGRGPSSANVTQLGEFDEIVDVRSEGEFAEDHIPGAVNCPVLNDEERARVGTLYKQVSSFDAKKTGAALISANIARHLLERFHQRPRGWRPLVYCWRGGSRSGALAQVLHQVGWRVSQLEGGYRAYRRQVVAELALLPGAFTWRVVCGLTGAGKSRLLRALAQRGGQVLDLEMLAAHRGSVLGGLPDRPQPSQKMFESRVWHALRRFTSERPVYVEAESRKIGNLRVPEALMAAMWGSPCVVLDAPVRLRVELLKAEYGHFLTDPSLLVGRLECLTALYGRSVIDEWKQLANAHEWNRLTENLLVRHYDPAYTRSTLKHYPGLASAHHISLDAIDDAAFERLAHQCLARDAAETAKGRQRET